MIFQQAGKRITEFVEAFLLFFQFLGQLCFCMITKWDRVQWRDSLVRTLHVGSRLWLPLIAMSCLIGISVTISANWTLSEYNLQNSAMVFAQNIIIRDLAPLPIGFALCVHSALNLIESNHPNVGHSPMVVLIQTIIPSMLGIIVTALLLYTYVVAAFFLGVFLAFHFILHVSTDEYLIQLNDTLALTDMVVSILKTIFLAGIASLIAGYYYYDIAARVLTVRKAVSRIITRGLFWLIIASVIGRIDIWLPR